MNPPEPCNKCKYMYYYNKSLHNKVECIMGKLIGNKDCSHFSKWKCNGNGTQETESVGCPGCKREVRLSKMEMKPESVNKLISLYNGLCICCGANLLLSVYKKREPQ